VFEKTPLSMKTKEEVIKDVRDDPLSIASIGVSFMQMSKKNMKNLVHEIEEKEKRIRELEEEVQHIKSDQDNLKEFKVCVEGVRK
jgi:hypothetical protein